MNDFSIAKGKNTPAVTFSTTQGRLLISGKSYPENARQFYDDLFNTIKDCSYPASFTFELDFDYVSSSSVVSILEVIKNLKKTSPNTHFAIKFFYENGDDDMYSIGENYQRISGMEVEFLEK